ncbi:hypothetical protein X801_07070, partial [Opisthorchis viverrini]
MTSSEVHRLEHGASRKVHDFNGIDEEGCIVVSDKSKNSKCGRIGCSKPTSYTRGPIQPSTCAVDEFRQEVSGGPKLP